MPLTTLNWWEMRMIYSLDLPNGDVDFVVIGNLQEDASKSFGSYTVNVQNPPAPLLDAAQDQVIYRDSYFYKNRPQYEDLSVGSIVSVKDHGAAGDGTTDDTAAIVAALALATTDNLIYFPPGSYIVTSTIVIPAHTRITGQVWSQLVASGDYFADMTSPKVIIQVSNRGDVGTVETSDMLFTSIGELPELVIMKCNVPLRSRGQWVSGIRTSA